MKAVNRGQEWSKYTGVSFPEFYRTFRKLCAPPMHQIMTLDVGEVWGYNTWALMVVACVGDRSLLVAYEVCGTREEIECMIRQANDWQYSEQDELPALVPLVCAARVDTAGGLVVRHLVPGDWVGLMHIDRMHEQILHYTSLLWY